MNLNEQYKNLLLDIYNNGIIKYSNKKECKEISPYIFKLDNIKDNIITLEGFETNLNYANSEFEWYMYGDSKINFSPLIQKIWSKYSDDGCNVNSNYGERIFGKHPILNLNQYQFVMKKLIEDKDTRQAVININSYFDKEKSTKDFPCTMDLQFIIINNKLNLITHMRSNDVYFGFRNDLYCFTELQKIFAINLEMEYGNYFHIVNSMHLYKEQYDKVEKLLE
jgi:thymidylate synthase